MSNRYKAAILALVMTFGVLFSSLGNGAFAEEDTVQINSREDFYNFAKKCMLDSYSVNKTVSLNCDIDFSNSTFNPIATFSGVFMGNGHTVSGIRYEEKGSYVGLFRYVGKTGKISSLNVKGVLSPGGSKCAVGGIAGENSGSIENCSFEGVIEGENNIGGIAGINTDYGKIVGCVSRGSVTGENSTGGVAGKNKGFIQNCTNNATVNTVYEEKKNTISEIDTDIGAIVENYKNKKEEDGATFLEHSDTGGIAGYSSGIIQGSSNNASVGYEHIGYNVGGIVGRQSGYVLGCENHGTVRGRKDVGGIAGQAEPYVLLSTSENILANLRVELNSLNSMINAFTADADDLADDTKRSLDEISKYASAAQKESETLVNIGTDFIDGNIEEINARAAILSNTIDKLTPVFESLENCGDDFADALDSLAEAVEILEIEAPDLSDETDDITAALKKIARSEKSVSKAMEKAEKAKKNLKDAVSFKDEDAARKAIESLAEAVEELTEAKREIRASVEEIKNVLMSRPEDFEEIGINAKKIAEELAEIGKGKVTEIKSLVTIKKSLDTIVLNKETDFDAIRAAAKNISGALDGLGDAFEYITEGIGDLGGALSNFSYGLSDYLETVSDNISDVKEKAEDAIKQMKYTTEDITDAVGQIKTICEDLSKEDKLEFVKLGDDFTLASENLFDSLTGISDEMDKLGDVISKGQDDVSKDIRNISNQFNLVMNLLLDEVDSLKNASFDSDDLFLDVSDENIESTKQGKIEDCKNFAAVEADRNTGGIVGAIAIEYLKDPEDEIEKPDTLNFTYKSKAIIYSCVNKGTITGKKDCVGGICGTEEIGTIYKCENYGNCESTDGNFVGGIVGKSESTVRKCYAKSKIAGQRYVGGIGGKGDVVNASYAIVNVTGDENFGAILGEGKNRDNIYANFFTDNGLGGVDNISYEKRAEPVEFDVLKEKEDIPREFISFCVKFTADGKTVKKETIKYGMETGRIKYPQVPEKDGYYGAWKKCEEEYVKEDIVIECDYEPYITIIASEEKNENGKLALALCEGKFTHEAKLRITDGVAKAPVEQGENVKVYDVSVLNGSIKDTDSVQMRILNENYDKVTLWVLKNGRWGKEKTTSRGKYVKFAVEGGSNTICVKYERSYAWVIVIICVITASATVFFIIRRKRKKVE